MIKKRVFTMKVFDKQAFTAGAGLIKTSPVLDMSQIAPEWSFTLQHKFSGTGTLKLECLVSSTRDGDFFEACADLDATAPTGTVKIVAFAPILAPFMKIVATASVETVADLDVWLNSR